MDVDKLDRRYFRYARPAIANVASNGSHCWQLVRPIILVDLARCFDSVGDVFELYLVPKVTAGFIEHMCSKAHKIGLFLLSGLGVMGIIIKCTTNGQIIRI